MALLAAPSGARYRADTTAASSNPAWRGLAFTLTALLALALTTPWSGIEAGSAFAGAAVCAVAVLLVQQWRVQGLLTQANARLAGLERDAEVSSREISAELHDVAGRLIPAWQAQVRRARDENAQVALRIEEDYQAIRAQLAELCRLLDAQRQGNGTPPREARGALLRAIDAELDALGQFVLGACDRRAEAIATLNRMGPWARELRQLATDVQALAGAADREHALKLVARTEVLADDLASLGLDLCLMQEAEHNHAEGLRGRIEDARRRFAQLRANDDAANEPVRARAEALHDDVTTLLDELDSEDQVVSMLLALEDNFDFAAQRLRLVETGTPEAAHGNVESIIERLEQRRQRNKSEEE